MLINIIGDAQGEVSENSQAYGQQQRIKQLLNMMDSIFGFHKEPQPVSKLMFVAQTLTKQDTSMSSDEKIDELTSMVKVIKKNLEDIQEQIEDQKRKGNDGSNGDVNRTKKPKKDGNQPPRDSDAVRPPAPISDNHAFTCPLKSNCPRDKSMIQPNESQQEKNEKILNSTNVSKG